MEAVIGGPPRVMVRVQHMYVREGLGLEHPKQWHTEGLVSSPGNCILLSAYS